MEWWDISGMPQKSVGMPEQECKLAFAPLRSNDIEEALVLYNYFVQDVKTR